MLSVFTWRDSSNNPQVVEADLATFEAHHVVLWEVDKQGVPIRIVRAVVATSVHDLRERSRSRS